MPLHERAACETLNLEPAFRHGWNRQEYVQIGVIESDAKADVGTISLNLVQFDHQYICKNLQACLTVDEIDLLIFGLLEAKKRMVDYRAQG